MHVFIIVAYTLHDFVCHRLLLIALAILSFSYLFAQVLTSLVVGGHSKIIVDCMFLAYQLFLLFFVTVFVVPFLSRAARYNIFSFFLTKSLSRNQFLWGVHGGILLVIGISCLLYYASALFILFWQTGQWLFYLVPAFATIATEGLLMASAALFFSVWLSSAATYIVLFTFYTMSYLNHNWLIFVEKKTSGIIYVIGMIMYYIVPDLSIIDIKSAVMYEITYQTMRFYASLTYIFLFCFIFMQASQLIFNRKQIG